MNSKTKNKIILNAWNVFEEAHPDRSTELLMEMTAQHCHCDLSDVAAVLAAPAPAGGETPRTDKEVLTWTQFPDSPSEMPPCVSAPFARQLERELTALRAAPVATDTARLDWLEKNGHDVLCHRPADDDTDQRPVFWVRGYLDGTPRTLRAAIDAARQQEGSK